MELSFKISEWITSFIEEPMYIAMWAAFGMMALLFTLAFILILLRKIFPVKIIDKLSSPFINALLLTWIIGFVSMILLLFIGISGIKMLLIWCSMLIVYLIFSIINRNYIDRFLKDIGKEK